MAQGKLIAANKQNQIGQYNLMREITKLEEVEKSDLRMLETARQRFRTRYKKFEIPPLSSGSDAIDVRMYDTHNPGFCYHCTGAIKASRGEFLRETITDAYEVVHSMLFTNEEADPDKVLCLHLLAAHSAKPDNNESADIRPITQLLERGKREHFTGAWNSILPCYVVNIQRDNKTFDEFPEDIKYHKDPLARAMENETIKDFELKYKQYVAEHSDIGMVLETDRNLKKMIPNSIGKMPIISPHIYSLLGAAHELRIKQAIAEGSTRRRLKRSSMDFDLLDEKSLSFRLDDEDDVSGRLTDNNSYIGWGLGARYSKTSTIRSPSRRSTLQGSTYRLDRSITTLKNRVGRLNRPIDAFTTVMEDKNQGATEVITIKPSCSPIKGVISKTSSSKSPYHNMFSRQFTTASSSFSSEMMSPNVEIRKFRRSIYLNAPVRSMDLRNQNYKTVSILVNNQIQALVHSVLDVLERVNPEKMLKIVNTARDPYEIRKMLVRPDIQLFVDSLMGQPLVSSPDSFVVSTATIVDEIDTRFERICEKELIALTLEMPPTTSLDLLVAEIRNNLFVDPNKTSKSKADTRVETFEGLKQKFLERGNKGGTDEVEEELKKSVFEVNSTCGHTKVETFEGLKQKCLERGNKGGTDEVEEKELKRSVFKVTSTCGHTNKWKASLSANEIAGIPNFPSVGTHKKETQNYNLTIDHKPTKIDPSSSTMGKEPDRDEIVVSKRDSQINTEGSIGTQNFNELPKMILSSVSSATQEKKCKVQNTLQIPREPLLNSNEESSLPKIPKLINNRNAKEQHSIIHKKFRNSKGSLAKPEQQSSNVDSISPSSEIRDNQLAKANKLKQNAKPTNGPKVDSITSTSKPYQNIEKGDEPKTNRHRNNSNGQSKLMSKKDISSASTENEIYEEAKNIVRPKGSSITIGSVIGTRAGSAYRYTGIPNQGESRITLAERPTSPKCQFKATLALSPSYIRCVYRYTGIHNQEESRITLAERPTSPKCQFKPWKATHDPGYLEPNRVILRRMTNTQRILVGQMCASLKTRKINTEGLVEERTPIAALITPVLSHESIRILTQGTRAKQDKMRNIQEEKEENTNIATDKLTGPVLAKVRQEVAVNETERRLKLFLKSEV